MKNLIFCKDCQFYEFLHLEGGRGSSDKKRICRCLNPDFTIHQHDAITHWDEYPNPLELNKNNDCSGFISKLSHFESAKRIIKGWPRWKQKIGLGIRIPERD